MNAVIVSKCQVPIFKTEPNDYHCSKEYACYSCFFWVRLLPPFLGQDVSK